MLPPRVLRCRACRRIAKGILEDYDVCRVVIDDVDDKDEDDSADAFVPTHVLAEENNLMHLS